MKLKRNCLYRTRAGELIFIEPHSTHNSFYLERPKRAVRRRLRYWFPNGKFKMHKDSDYDLVEEVTDPVLKALYED